jgi:hypothetical protein
MVSNKNKSNYLSTVRKKTFRRYTVIENRFKLKIIQSYNRSNEKKN